MLKDMGASLWQPCAMTFHARHCALTKKPTRKIILKMHQISDQDVIRRKRGGPCESEDALRCVVEQQQEVSGKCISLSFQHSISLTSHAIFLCSEVCGRQVGVGW